MTQELTSLPDSFAAGTTVVYRKTLTDYPAGDGWTFTLYIAGAKIVEPVEAEADGDSFVVTVPASATTGEFTAGLYKYSERVDKDGEVYEVDSGVVDILPDLTVAADQDEQEWTEQEVSLLRAHIKGRLPSGMESYQVAGRVVSKMPLKEAVDTLSRLEARLERLKNPGGVSTPIYVEFKPTGYEGA